jgi:diaminopimelate decarboxylase
MLHAHLWPATASVDGQGHLHIGGCDCVTLVARYGTPLYLLDEATLRASCRAYRSAFQAAYPGASAVHYASKALLALALAQLVAQEGLGLDVVSGGELALARAASIPMEQVHLHGNAKTDAELDRALAWGVGHIVVDGLDELARLASRTQGLPRPQPLMLRLTPNIAVDTHAHIATGHAASKFGLPAEQLDAAAQLIAQAPGLRLAGLHAHLGSQLFDPTPYARAVEHLLDAAAQLRDRHGLAIDTLSPGGGLGIAYTPEQQPGDLAAYAQTIANAVVTGCESRRLPLPRLVLEPGRAIVGRAGVALYSVIGRKQAPGQPVFLHIDGGMGDNIRPALYGARYHGLLANRASEPARQRFTIAGRFCESGDLLIHDLLLPADPLGDLLAVAVAGAYTLSMASTYNLVPRPALVLVGEGTARLIQRREDDEDLLRRELPL